MCTDGSFVCAVQIRDPDLRFDLALGDLYISLSTICSMEIQACFGNPG